MADIPATGEPNLYDFLRQDAAVAALIADGIYHERIPQQGPNDVGPFPCCCWFRAGGLRTVGFSGQDQLVEGHYQLDVYAADADTKLLIARAVRKALVGYAGPMGDCSVDQITIQTDFDQNPAMEPGLYRRTILFTIWYWED